MIMFLISILCMGLSLMALVVNGSPHIPMGMKEGDACPAHDNFPESYCRNPKDCETLPVYIDKKIFSLYDIPSCGFPSATSLELLCCPLEMPRPKTTTKPPIVNDIKSFKHLAPVSYLMPPTFDDYVYRCTAIILSSTQVLATSKCVGRKAYEKPIKVLFGVSDMEGNFDADNGIGITRTKQMNNDLALFALETPLDLDDPSMSNVEKAELCSEYELEGNPKLLAVAFSQYNDGTNCKLFATRLEKHSNCYTVKNERQVEHLEAPGSHLCVKPIWDKNDHNEHNGCSKCLTASSSVLHVERNDGSYCVAGIATPTTDECIVNDNPLYYTSIVNSAALYFIYGSVPSYRNTDFVRL